MQGIQRYYQNEKCRRTRLIGLIKRGGRTGGGTPSGLIERRVTNLMPHYIQVNCDGK